MYPQNVNLVLDIILPLDFVTLSWMIPLRDPQRQPLVLRLVKNPIVKWRSPFRIWSPLYLVQTSGTKHKGRTQKGMILWVMCDPNKQISGRRDDPIFKIENTSSEIEVLISSPTVYHSWGVCTSRTCVLTHLITCTLILH